MALSSLARVREMFANMVVDRKTQLGHFRLHYLGHQGHTAAAGGAGLGACLDFTDGGFAFGHCGADLSFGDVVAGANLRTVGQRIRT